MVTSKIYVGAKVQNKKGQKGEIVRIITKSSGYVEVLFESGSKGKEMAYNLVNENGEVLKAAPKAKAKKATVITDADRMQMWKEKLLCVNNRSMSNHYSIEMCVNALNYAHSKNEFYNSLITAFFNAKDGKGRLSEKQAYYLAKFIVEKNK
ncbi:hypothetical protein CUC00_08415 [Prevotella intermedia]|uniref:hypothetical protein n=1 Tax=Prevotella intermedia TaxID=28131 RepID=UPI000C1BD7E8|nr:hypothetical protein [Prevotella intermedia]ATV32542.1 hypothetical protein CTM44_01520 [Prevotella intermedia]ATV41047.1 hypothetical protein CUC00_08415 [Prevotella intermedia]